MSWDRSGLSHRPEHDDIKDALYRRLSRFSKKELEGISYQRSGYQQNPHKSTMVLEKERYIDPHHELPSGKSYCRADIHFRVGHASFGYDEKFFAFEVKTSRSDAMNWPEQAADYRSAGYRPVLVSTVDVVAELGPGHRLVTDSDHVIAHDHELYFSVDNPPAPAAELFNGETPFETPLDHCPDCGFRLEYRADRDGTISQRCKACNFGLR